MGTHCLFVSKQHFQQEGAPDSVHSWYNDVGELCLWLYYKLFSIFHPIYPTNLKTAKNLHANKDGS